MLTNVEKQITKVSEDREKKRKEKGIKDDEEKKMVKQTKETIKSLKQKITSDQIAANGDIGDQFYKFVQANSNSEGRFEFDDEIDGNHDFEKTEP